MFLEILDWISLGSFLFLAIEGGRMSCSVKARNEVKNALLLFLPKKWRKVVRGRLEKMEWRLKNKDKLAEISYYTKEIEKNPGDSYTYVLIGNARAEIGEDGAALEDYKEAIRINPRETLAYGNTGNIFRWMGDGQKDFQLMKENYEKAIENWGKAIEIIGFSCEMRGVYYWKQGQLYEKLGKWELAYDSYNKAKEDFVRDSGVRNVHPEAIGRCYAKIWEIKPFVWDLLKQQELQVQYFFPYSR